MSKKPIFLWAVPRSASTVFERVFIERGDCEVFHEPFSVSFYYSNERRSQRYSDVPSKPEYSYAAVHDEIFSNKKGLRPFVKEIVFHVKDFWTPDFMERTENTFLIRDPLPALASQYKLLPDFTFEETGYEILSEMFDHCCEKKGAPPPVIDAEDFMKSPDKIMKTYCSRVGLDFKKEAMSWEKRNIALWGTWERWHKEATESTRIEPPKAHPDPSLLPKRVQKMIDKARPLYNHLKEHSLKV